jgi:hypothetical protein
MRQFILKQYRKSRIAKVLLAWPTRIYKVIINKYLSDEAWYRQMFLWSHGYALDIDNPKTLNEKIQWLKLHNRQSHFTAWADKYKVRDHIRELVGNTYLIPLLAVADDPAKIDFEALPTPFIIKPNHLSGCVKIVRDKKGICWPSVVKEGRSWLKENLFHTGREWQYKNILPKIIVEQLLVDDDGIIPLDYKFHCFHGEIVAIQVDIDRETDHRRNFYDREWKQLPFIWSIYAGDKPLWPHGRHIDKPAVLAEMIAMTEKLASRFDYIRIDWYVLDDRVYFGEVTFHHGGGYEQIRPLEWDKNLGAMLKLPEITPHTPKNGK